MAEQKSKKKKIIKYLLNILLIIVLMGLTAYMVFSKQELPQIIEHIKRVNPMFLLGGAALLFIFVCSESVIFKYLFRRFKVSVTLRQCVVYSFVGFFFSAVTPSSSGGQPAQIIWMKRDGIDLGQSSLVLIVVTMAYKLALVVLGGVLFIWNYRYVREHIGGMIYIFSVGMALNVFMIAVLLIVIYKTALAERMARGILGVMSKIRIVRNRQRAEEKLLGSLEKYRRGSRVIRGNTGMLIVSFLISIVQRVAFFAITYVVYRAFHLSKDTFSEIITLQVILAIALDILPFPGGIGANESGFMMMYMKVFGKQLVIPGMLLSRGLNYYLLLVAGGLITAVSYIMGGKKGRLARAERKADGKKE